MSYDTAKLIKCGDFCALTWFIFADLVTYVLMMAHDGKNDGWLKSEDAKV